MGERTDGRWASKFVGISAPRQNGKSQLIVARALAGVLLFGEKMIIISAHETDTAREVWKRLIDVVEDNPSVESRVSGRMDAINREFISFGEARDRQTIKLKARRATGSRGFSADCLLLDEAQILGRQAWGSIVPTISARPNPQLWLFGTPPTPEDDPHAFKQVRTSAIAGKARHTWLEWSASRMDDFDSVETWARANPAFGVRIFAEACEDDRSAMDDDQFALERLGIWPDDDVQAAERVATVEDWRSRIVVPDPEWPVSAVGLDMDPTGRLWVGIAQQGGDVVHVELDPDDVFADGVDATVGLLHRLCRRRLPVVMPPDSGAVALEAPMRGRGMKVYRLNIGEASQASAGLVQAIKDESVGHLDDPVLEECVRGSARAENRSREGLVRWTIGRAGVMGGAPLYAVACARYGAVKWAPTPRTGRARGR